MDLHEAVVEKLIDYGFKIHAEQKIEGECEYYIAIDNVAVFINEKDNYIKISYMADMKPEDAASFLLVVQEIEEIEKIVIMESFIFDNEKNLLSGQDAYNEVRRKIADQAIRNFTIHQFHTKMLEEVDPNRLPQC
jgi:hypothetical protein